MMRMKHTDRMFAWVEHAATTAACVKPGKYLVHGLV